ncbi:MAG TPA: DUF2064 domain-containing protein, partial [Chthoniobacterales bacterium]
VDSDSPNLPLHLFEMLVVTLFESPDTAVVGPCADGGYYAIGLRRPHRRVFEEIAWSTDQVYRETVERAAEVDLPLISLPAWYDVDDQASLQRLMTDLFESPVTYESGLRAGPASESKAFLRRILETEGRERIWPKRLLTASEAA